MKSLPTAGCYKFLLQLPGKLGRQSYNCRAVLLCQCWGRRWYFDAGGSTYKNCTRWQIICVAGPRIWNSLPPSIRDLTLSAGTFATLLKTYLFV